jgi:hypothetical protein
VNLNSQEQIALKEFTDFLSSRLTDNYLYSCLFGSKARGDAQEGSDLDVAVVLKHSDYQTKYVLIGVRSCNATSEWPLRFIPAGEEIRGFQGHPIMALT